MTSPDVDAYIAALDGERRAKLETLRAAIHAAFEDVTESIEWKMPVFRRGERWFATASQRSYLSLYFGGEPIAASVAAADPRLKYGKACVNVRDRVPLPMAAIEAGIAQTLG